MKRLGKNSTLGENEVNLPTIKRIVARFHTRPYTIRFSDCKDFLTSLNYTYGKAMLTWFEEIFEEY